MAGKTQEVIIVGGSLGGLFAGIVLKRLGCIVHIFERNPTPLLHDQGAGIVAGSHVQAYLTRFDRTDRPIAVTSKLRQYLNQSGLVIHQEHTEQRMTSWDLLYHILRANYDCVGSDYCQTPATEDGEGTSSYNYGRQVLGLKTVGERIQVEYDTTQGNCSTATADLVIAADGPSSTVRRLLTPEIQRTYAGYVAWRGTVAEHLVSPSARETFVEKFTFFHAPGTQILAYVIPGPNGTLEPGERLINWVWYCNYAEDSPELHDLMTDSEGATHRYTLPPDKNSKPEVLEQQRAFASQLLPPQFAELVRKTVTPFVQAITDVLASENIFYDGKVLVLGDALAGFRPHTAASTNQAAYDAILLSDLMEGQMALQAWKQKTMAYAIDMQRRGVTMGERSQFGRHPFA
ncbi:uncharacterized protein KY384_006493 [Bacidia gigantensis]|uniref:uncharacterized protein n=1 Tax=Bacidia gigantensis TaxID=2732470 RepID=UPI001D03846A|nr:uncharacterized protein KY384_006493 [Bacidia gigantensis]KAG8528804.1 hypothetical protein KY384_006493 [Bacidia gigantensis]